jgi:flagellar motor switch protein FliG
MSDTRRSALALHALSADDREWLLARLPERQRAELQKLLAELTSLGIPAERRVVEMAMAKRTAKPAAPVASTGPRERLDAAAARTMFELLKHEPPALIALLLACAPWPWQKDLLRQLPAALRRRVEDALASRPTVGPELAGALIEIVAARLPKPSATRAAKRPSAAPARTPRWLVALRRVLGARREEARA